MNKNPRILKGYTIGIVLLFVATGFIPSTAASVPIIGESLTRSGNFFGLNSNVAISWNANVTEEPIVPRGELRCVELSMMFWVTWGIFGRLINYLLQGQQIIMKLSVVDKPEWCTTTISQGTLSVTIPRFENNYEIVHTYLTVMVDDNAPTFELFPVTIQAIIEPLHGPFGLIPVMQGTTETVNVTFTVGYKPLLNFDLPEGNIIETPPLVQVQLPIGITNLGNGITIVENEVVSYPDGWTVSLPPQLVLEVDEYKEINLSIIAPYAFTDEKSITMSFTPHSFDNYSLVGQTTIVSVIAYYRPVKNEKEYTKLWIM
ncbi:MAG: hypothetical protein NTY91_07980 [Euryarchaeota archaeon]|nr:hypothetical protein [Euryarchaeota archaeon]